MKILVIIPTFNYAFLLANAIDSVLSQRRKADLVMVVDDASQDQVLAKVVSDRYNIPFVGREKNLGHYENFKRILTDILVPSKYDAACFITADNWIHPDYLLETEKLLTGNTAVVGTQTYIVGEYAEMMYHERPGWEERSNNHLVWTWKRSLINENCWLHGSSLFSIDAAKKSEGFGTTNGPDWNLWRNIAKEGYDLDKVERPLLYYRQHRLNHYQSTYEKALIKL